MNFKPPQSMEYPQTWRLPCVNLIASTKGVRTKCRRTDGTQDMGEKVGYICPYSSILLSQSQSELYWTHSILFY